MRRRARTFAQQVAWVARCEQSTPTEKTKIWRYVYTEVANGKILTKPAKAWDFLADRIVNNVLQPLPEGHTIIQDKYFPETYETQYVGVINTIEELYEQTEYWAKPYIQEVVEQVVQPQPMSFWQWLWQW